MVWLKRERTQRVIIVLAFRRAAHLCCVYVCAALYRLIWVKLIRLEVLYRSSLWSIGLRVVRLVLMKYFFPFFSKPVVHRTLGRLGDILAHLVGVLERLGRVLGASWGV